MHSAEAAALAPALLSTQLSVLQPWLALPCVPGAWGNVRHPLHAAPHCQGSLMPWLSFELSLLLHMSRSIPEISDCHFLVCTDQDCQDTGKLQDLC